MFLYWLSISLIFIGVLAVVFSFYCDVTEGAVTIIRDFASFGFLFFPKICRVKRDCQD